MDRLNGEGIQRDQLKWAFTRRDIVMTARRVDSCLLCKAPKVNEAGICELCWAMLSDEELRLGERWTAGVGP